MTTVWSIAEVYELAIQIEKNGAAFYRTAAKRFSDREPRAVLQDLAVMEDGHRQTFESMRDALPDDVKVLPWNDPDGEAHRYLQVFAGGQVFDITADPGETLEHAAGPGEVLLGP